MSSHVEDSVESYRGNALKILKHANAKVGSIISVKSKEGFETTGLLIPRYERADDNIVVLKLKSGYNVGIDVTSIDSISVLEQTKEITERTAPKSVSQSNKNVLLLSTGGTIASRVDYRTGAVHPALSAEDLYAAVPELGEIANIQPEVVFSSYSENLSPLDWEKLARRIVEASNTSRLDGICVMLGTDTLGYIAAALSFALLGLDLPVVCVGAKRSSDRPSSDAALNLKAAVRFAASSRFGGVFVAMHKNANDETIALHLGTRVRKNHTSRRDAFESIDIPLVAEVRSSEITTVSGFRNQEIEERFKLKTKFEPKVALLKFHPGFDPEILDHLESKGVKGIIIEGTGLGHVSSETVKQIELLCSRGKFIGITSQCIWGRVDLNVYDTGRDLISAEAVPLENMLGETALAKLSWALGNFPLEQANKIMQRNFAGEVTSRTTVS